MTDKNWGWEYENFGYKPNRRRNTFFRRSIFSRRNLACVLTVCLLLALSTTSIVRAQEFSGQDELEDQVRDKKKEILIIESKIAESEKKIKELKQQQESIYNEISILDAELEKTQQEIDMLQVQTDQVNADIDDTNRQIDETQADLDTQVEVWKANMNETQIISSTSFLEMLVETDSISELVRRVEYQEIIDEQNRIILEDLRAIEQHLQEEKNALEDKKVQLDDLKSQVETKKQGQQDQINVKQTLLAQTQGLQSQYQGIINENSSARQQLESDLNRIEAEIRRRIEEERQRQIQNGEDPTPATPSRAGYVTPTTGKYTMYFMEKYPDWMLRAYKWLNNSNYMYHTGLDIATAAGTPVVAPKGGTVAYVRDFGSLSYGRMIMIDHGDGIVTLYGHLNSFSVSQGQKVSQGQQIGTVGSSGFSTGSHLHFEVRENGKLVDPLLFI